MKANSQSITHIQHNGIRRRNPEKDEKIITRNLQRITDKFYYDTRKNQNDMVLRLLKLSLNDIRGEMKSYGICMN